MWLRWSDSVTVVGVEKLVCEEYGVEWLWWGRMKEQLNITFVVGRKTCLDQSVERWCS